MSLPYFCPLTLPPEASPHPLSPGLAPRTTSALALQPLAQIASQSPRQAVQDLLQLATQVVGSAQSRPGRLMAQAEDIARAVDSMELSAVGLEAGDLRQTLVGALQLTPGGRRPLLPRYPHTHLVDASQAQATATDLLQALKRTAGGPRVFAAPPLTACPRLTAMALGLQAVQGVPRPLGAGSALQSAAGPAAVLRHPRAFWSVTTELPPHAIDVGSDQVDLLALLKHFQRPEAQQASAPPTLYLPTPRPHPGSWCQIELVGWFAELETDWQ